MASGPASPLLSFEVQPARIDVADTCAGREIRLYPPADRPFASEQGGRSVHFTPCGVIGRVTRWRSSEIRVIVPSEAKTGAVWIAAANAAQEQMLSRGTACLQALGALGAGGVNRPSFECDESILGPTGNPAITRAQFGRPPHLLPGAQAGVPHAGGPTPIARGLPFRASAWTPATRGLPTGLDNRLCKLLPPRPEPGVEFEVPRDLAGLRVDRQVVDGACFEACTGITQLVGGAPANHLAIRHVPRVRKFRPIEGTKTQPNLFRVERGDVTMEWEVESDAANPVVTASMGATTVGGGLSGTGTRPVLALTEARLRGRNDCGAMSEAKVTLEPRTPIVLSPTRIVLGPGGAERLGVSLRPALTTPVQVTVWAAGTAGVTVQPETVDFPIGAPEQFVTITRAPGIASAQAGVHIAEIYASPARVQDEAHLFDAAESVSVVGAAADAPPIVGSGSVRITGRLRFQRCSPVPPQSPPGTLPVCDPLDFPAIRGARVELWSDAGGVWAFERELQTGEDGGFSIDVPYRDVRYNVQVVASNVAGQVNWRDNDATWFWKDLNRPQQATSGGTLRFDWDAVGSRDGGNFSALNALLVAWRYTLARLNASEEVGKRRFHRVSVIPASSSASGVTLAAGASSHIWLGWDKGLLSDKSVVHEYGHHLQRMSNNYEMWASMHNGCYMTTELRCRTIGDANGAAGDPDTACWINNDAFAWFEGFPTAFSAIVGRWDALTGNNLLSGANRRPHFPSSTACFLVTATHHSVSPGLHVITTNDVEDYVASAVYDLTWPSLADGGVGPLQDGLEEAFLDVALNTIRRPIAAGTMPSFQTFKAAWNARFPSNLAANQAILGRYGL